MVTILTVLCYDGTTTDGHTIMNGTDDKQWHHNKGQTMMLQCMVTNDNDTTNGNGFKQ